MRVLKTQTVLLIAVLQYLLSGPGFVSTSLGITTTIALSNRIPPPSTAPLTRNMVPCQWQRTLLPPPLPFSWDISFNKPTITLEQKFCIYICKRTHRDNNVLRYQYPWGQILKYHPQFFNYGKAP